MVNPILYESQGCFERDSCGGTIGVRGASAASIESRFARFKCMSGMEDGWYHSSKMETGPEFRDRTKRVVEWLWELHDHGNEKHLIAGAPAFKNLIVVAHGNLINAVLCGLIGGAGLFVHSNTGYTHVQLVTAGSAAPQRRVAAIKSMNEVCPLFPPVFHTGHHILDDHWIQEYLDD